ncbi:MAG: glycosyltransferase family 39 protein, partial [Candidatus Levybacteria bacterium]|nr:glycosyltransferase family 39 protein [Candidatus Levybacteria bacterium]
MTIAKFKFEIISVFVIIAVYFFLRTLFLDRLPIFTDEAIYVRWAQIASNDAAWRFISLTDGKQPLFIWISIIFMRIIDDPLLAVRSVSVMSGIFSMVGLFLLSLELFKKRSIAFISVVLYVFYPFAQVYDRMALYDSLLGAFMVWAIYFTVLLVRKVRLDIAYTLGFIIGGALLNKSSGIFSAYLMPIALILGDFKTLRDPRFLIKFALLALFAFAISQGLYSVLRLSPFF